MSKIIGNEVEEIIGEVDEDEIHYGIGLNNKEKIIKELDLQTLNCGAGDFLASFIMNQTPKRLVIYTIDIVAIFLLVLPLTILEGTFNDPNLTVQGHEMYGYLITTLFGIPAALLLLNMYFYNLPDTLLKLSISKKFLISRDDWNVFVRKANSIYNKRLLVYIPYILGLAIMSINMINLIFLRNDTWNSTPEMPYGTISGWIAQLNGFFLYYLMVLLIVRVVATYFVFKEYFKFPIYIQPLHPDNCGGLSLLGKLSARLNLGVFLFGLLLAAGILVMVKNLNYPSDSPVIFLAISGYLCGAVIMFFFPLYPAYKKMQIKKKYTLNQINKRFQEVNDHIMHLMQKEKSAISDQVAELDSLRRMYDIAAGMPVVPFDIQTISRFFISMVGPGVFIAIDALISQLIGKMT